MKRLYIGIGLLVGLLVLGIWLSAAFPALHDPLAHRLEQARTAAIAGDWPRAEALLKESRAQWNRYRHISAAVEDHGPLEQMDALFVRLEALASLRSEDEFAADCAELSRLAAALAEAQRFTWWNLL